MKVKKKITPERLKILALERKGDSIEFPLKMRERIRGTVGNINRDMKLNGHVKRDEIAFSCIKTDSGVTVIKNF